MSDRTVGLLGGSRPSRNRVEHVFHLANVRRPERIRVRCDRATLHHPGDPAVVVVPRFVTAVLLTPMLTIYSDFLGVLGGYVISVFFLGVPAYPYWQYSALGVDNWQIMEGLFKSIFFGGTTSGVSAW